MKYQVVNKKIVIDQDTGNRFLEIMNNFKNARLLIIGDFILDQYIWGKVSRISPEAPVPVVEVQKESFMPGGSLNVANNVRTLGGKVFPCGVVGNDFRGKVLIKALKKDGIECEGVIADKERPTTLKTRVIAHSQQMVRFDRENIEDIGAEVRNKILNFVKKKIKDVDGVIIEDYGKGLITAELLKGVLTIAKRNNKIIVVDPKEKHFSYYKGVTVVTPNYKEAQGAVDNTKLNKPLTLRQVGLKLLKQLDCKAVLVTLGEEGMALFEKGSKITKIPTAAREVFDVSGAGDTVAAVFTLALASGATMREAAMLSNLAAGVVVGKVGTAVVMPQELKNSFGR